MDQAPRNKYLTIGLLGLILLLAGTLRFWRIDAASFWLDEYLTVELSNGHGLAHLDLPHGEVISPVPDYVGLQDARPMREIWAHSARDVHPPLFYMVLRVWRELFGESDAAVRGLSAALSLVAIVGLFFAIEAQAGATPALWASLLMSVAAVQIEYAQEARSYMLLEATLLGAGAALLRIERYGMTAPRGIALGLLMFLAAMTHLLALPLLGIMIAYGLLKLRGRLRIEAAAAMVGGVMLFLIVWGPFAWAQSDGFISRTSFVLEEDWQFSRWLGRLAGLPLTYFATTPARSTVVQSLGAAIYVLPLLLMRKRPALGFWWMWLVLGIGSIAVVDLVRGGSMIEYPRYTMAMSPAAYALAALFLAHLEGWFRHIVPMLLSLACLAALEGAYLRYNANWRGFGNLINERFGERDMLVIYDDQPDPWLVRCHVVGIQYYARGKPVTLAFADGPPSSAVLGRAVASSDVWVLTPGLDEHSRTIFPGSRVVELSFHEHIGSLVKIELPPNPASSPASPPATGPGQASPP